MTYLWGGMLIIGIVFGALNGNLQAVTEAVVSSAGEAVSLCITMAGITAMWTGIMKIAENAGLVSQLAGRMRPVLKFLFPGLEPDSPACHYISLNFLSNLFGISWASTSAGLKAMEELDRLNKEECRRYDELVKSFGYADLQLLGLGHNGHIGFNEPGQAFETGTHCVDLQESTIEANKRFFASATDVPRQAYTMGIKTIMQAKKILVVVSGEDKAEIVKKAFFGPVIPGVPASILQMHNDVILVGDEAALSLI